MRAVRSTHSTNSASRATTETSTEVTRSTYATRTTGASIETDATPYVEASPPRTRSGHVRRLDVQEDVELAVPTAGTSTVRKCRAVDEVHGARNPQEEAEGLGEAPAFPAQPIRATASSQSATSRRSSQALSFIIRRNKIREQLADAREEKAAAQLAILEAEIELSIHEDDVASEIEVAEEISTVRGQRTADWINRSKSVADAPEEAPKTTNNAPQEPPQKKEQPAATMDLGEMSRAFFAAGAEAHRVEELPSFDGTSNEWLSFKRAYDESAAHLSESRNLARLRRCLTGAAKETVRCLFIGNTTSKEVMQMLGARFGRASALARAEMDKLKRLPHLTSNPKDIVDFAIHVQNATATIRALQITHHMHNADAVNEIANKLTPAMQLQYFQFAKIGNTSELEKLNAFMSSMADTYGPMADLETPRGDHGQPRGVQRRELARTSRHDRVCHVEDYSVSVGF